MKVITVKQPWASLIVHGIKDIENRTWPCPKKYIGKRVLIHAGVSKKEGWRLNGAQASLFGRSGSELYSTDFDRLPFGSIIGSVEIVDCIQNHPSVWAEKGVYNWVLANPILYAKPIENVKGKLSVWDYSGIKEVNIECPECGSIETAVEDYTTVPFTYIHSCNKCGHVIMKSEWNKVEEGGNREAITNG